MAPSSSDPPPRTQAHAVIRMPGVQMPPSARKASCRTFSRSGAPSDSTVSTRRPATWQTGTRQLFTGRPSRRTVHAPHSPSPQPSFVPVRPKSSRRTSMSRLKGGPPKRCGRPFTVSRSTLHSFSFPELYQGLELGNHEQVFGSTRGPLCLDQRLETEHTNGTAKELEEIGILGNAIVTAERRYFPEQVDSTKIRFEREVQPRRDCGCIEPKWKAGWSAPEGWIEGREGGTQAFDVFPRAPVADVDVVGDVGRTMRDRGQAANHHELDVSVAEGAQDPLQLGRAHGRLRREAAASARSARTESRACWALTTRSVGERRRFSMRRVKSTPNALARVRIGLSVP